MRWDYLARSQDDIEALRRLASDDNAVRSWRKLMTETPRRETLYSVARTIGRAAVCARLTPDQKKTKSNIEDAAEEAVALSKRLVALIESNASLRNRGEDLLPLPERAALERIGRGLISQAVDKHRIQQTENIFSDDIERLLDELQVRDFPGCAGMTSMDAYLVVGRMQFHDDFFIGMLQRFSELAQESSALTPIVPRPNKANTDVQAFSLSCCCSLVYHYDSPHCDVVAGFASAVFNQVVDTELVKKWWFRRGADFRRDVSDKE